MANPQRVQSAAPAVIDDKDRRIAELERQLRESASGLTNVSMRIDGNMLVMTVDLSRIEDRKGKTNAKGDAYKTDGIASTGGNHSIDLPNGRKGYVNLNIGAYHKAK